MPKRETDEKDERIKMNREFVRGLARRSRKRHSAKMTELHPGREPTCPDWKHGEPDLRAWYWQERARLSERIIGDVLTGKQIGHGHHMADLEEKVKMLRRQVRIMQECAEHKNLQLRATNMFVGCTGGCTDKSFEDAGVVDEEFVKEVELTATRLRSWFTNWKGRNG